MKEIRMYTQCARKRGDQIMASKKFYYDPSGNRHQFEDRYPGKASTIAAWLVVALLYLLMAYTFYVIYQKGG
jgi:hypothetical protein